MVKMKSIEESVENYVASTGLAILRYHRFLVKTRGFKPDYAMKVAIDYGFNMLSAGIGSKDELASAESMFRELSALYNELGDVCYEAINHSNKAI